MTARMLDILAICVSRFYQWAVNAILIDDFCCSFNACIVPSTIRHRRLSNGVCWLETDSVVQALSVVYPLWEDLSETARGLAELLPRDRDLGIDNTLGYLFFSERASCIPLFELYKLHEEWNTDGLIDYPALMNAVWQSFPDYAAVTNSREQAGANDVAGMLLRDLGMEAEPRICSERLISITPGIGTHFLTFQRGPVSNKENRI